jgi:hypothetical protein
MDAVLARETEASGIDAGSRKIISKEEAVIFYRPGYSD